MPSAQGVPHSPDHQQQAPLSPDPASEGELDVSVTIEPELAQLNPAFLEPVVSSPTPPAGMASETHPNESSSAILPQPPGALKEENSGTSPQTTADEHQEESGNPSLVAQLHQRQLLDTIVDLTHPRSSLQEPVAAEKYTFKSTVAKSRDSLVEIYRDNDLQRDIKRVSLSAAGLSKKKTLRHFVHRAQILGQLSHPNIAPIFDFRVDETGKLSFQTTLSSGSTLEEALAGLSGNNQFARKIYTTEKLMRCFMQTAQAIAHAHHHGVFHHALHPGHIHMASFGEVNVEGWDYPVIKAHPRTHVPTSSSRVGQQASPEELSESQNLAYLAPEQVKETSQVCDERTDVYALGAILYALLTHSAPFSGDRHSVIGSIINGLYEPIGSRASEHQRSVPVHLVNVCTKAMNVEPSERFQTVPEFIAALEQAVPAHQRATTNSETVAVSFKSLMQNPAQSLKWVLGASGLVVLCALLATLLFFRASPTDNVDALIAKGDLALQKGSEMYRGGKPLNDFIQQTDREFETTRRQLLNAVSHFQTVLQTAPDRVDVKMKLVESYFGLWRIAERSGNTADKKFLSEQIRIHQPNTDTKRNPFLSFIEASFDMDVQSNPSGADVFLYRYSEDEGGLSVPVPVRPASAGKPIQFEQEWLSQWNQNKKANRNPLPSSDAFFSQDARFNFGKTPVSLKQLPVGSYVILVKKEGFQPQRYPFLLSRQNQIGELDITLQSDAATDSHYKSATFIPASPSRWLQPKGGPFSASANTTGYFMSTTEVSLELYSQFLEDLCRKGKWEVAFRRMPRNPKQKYFRLSSGCTIQPAKDLRSDWKTHPVTGVTYHDASAFLSWYSGQTGENMRLPSVQEWNHAACGQDNRTYTWGKSPMAIPQSSPEKTQNGTVFPTFQALAEDISPYGISGLSSGAAEWLISSEDISQNKQRPFNPKTDLKKPQPIGGATPASPTGHPCQSMNKVSGNMVSDDIGFRFVFYPKPE